MDDLAEKEILFIYNARSGPVHALMDYAHKMFSPKTYPCSLCGITYGHLGMKKVWADYLKTLPYAYRFLYRDHLKHFPQVLQDALLPVVFLRQDETYVSLLNASDFAQIDTLETLMQTLSIRLEA
ncbi:MAG: hypothetical protein QGI45_15175 [Myxococcota bacterium]|nr:hypothetical protein [Myxococcota bacterium]